VTFDFGDTKARRLSAQILAHCRFNEEFGDLVGGKGTPLRGPFTDVSVMSTKPPDRPEVDYIIPLLRWTRGYRDGTSVREGGWFRIWLKRGWYSSGDGEQLALVCWPSTEFAPIKRGEVFRWASRKSTVSVPPSAIEPLLTRWGSDPLWYEEKTLDTLPQWVFLNRLPGLTPVVDLRSQIDPTAPGAGAADTDTRATLALYTPVYDADRDRWHVDIRLDPAGSYFPFMRLALARYQPHSIPGAELSTIVATEFIQLLPTRSATVTATRTAGDLVTVQVSVSGTFLQEEKDPDPGQKRSNTTTFRARVERRSSRWGSGPDDTTQNAEVGATTDVPPGDWLPMTQSDRRDIEVFLSGRDGADTVSASVSFSRDGSSQYSLFVEEWEPTLASTSSDQKRLGRLVYADRLMLSF
jgi:hypothetical protein